MSEFTDEQWEAYRDSLICFNEEELRRVVFAHAQSIAAYQAELTEAFRYRRKVLDKAEHWERKYTELKMKNSELQAKVDDLERREYRFDG